MRNLCKYFLLVLLFGTFISFGLLAMAQQDTAEQSKDDIGKIVWSQKLMGPDLVQEDLAGRVVVFFFWGVT
ncbi:hypothetical protein ACFL54_08265 [Planctomycetota bacterium]